MDATKKCRVRLDVDALANKTVVRRKKRDLNEPIHYEINGKKVSVFTPEFLEENRLVEIELRKLRKLNNDYEEHNSVLVKYIENLTISCSQLFDELKELKEFQDTFRPQLDSLRAEVKETYGIEENGQQS